jgi:hypothetical protein
MTKPTHYPLAVRQIHACPLLPRRTQVRLPPQAPRRVRQGFSDASIPAALSFTWLPSAAAAAGAAAAAEHGLRGVTLHALLAGGTPLPAATLCTRRSC